MKSDLGADLVSLYVHEILFSWSIAFLAVSLIFLFAFNLSIPFIHLEVSINHFVGVRQTDVIRGYLTYLIASTMLALCIGTSLHISSSTQTTKWVLCSGSGLILLLSPAIFWFCYYQVGGWPFGWPYRWSPVELAAAVSCMTLYLLGKWSVPGWINTLLLAAHYNFWYWTQASNPEKANYAGPIAPIVGFCSVLAWGVYVTRRAKPWDTRDVSSLPTTN
jgi:hypothetical protein